MTVDLSFAERLRRRKLFNRYACEKHQAPIEGCAACYNRWELIECGGPTPTNRRQRVGCALVRLKYRLLWWLEE